MPTIANLTPDDQLVFQCYATSWLLFDLDNNRFLESDYFRNMNLLVPELRSMWNEIQITNQGCALMVLYALLVVPKEKLFSNFPGEVATLNSFLAANSQNTSTTYTSDSTTIDFVRHIRNAVAHARVTFRPSDAIIFEDCMGNQTFYTELPLPQFREFISKLQIIHIAYGNSREQAANT